MRFYALSSSALAKLAIFSACALFAATHADAQQIVRVPEDRGSLQEALNSVPDGGVIELAQGTYAAPAGGFTIFPRFPDASVAGFTVRAAPGATVVLNGGRATEILTLTTPRPVTFERITFANGVSSTDGRSGAISMDKAQANFVGCTFENNAGSAPRTGGGAVWINESNVSFQSCTFKGNTSKQYGGAIAAGKSSVFIRDARFTDNRSNVAGHAEFSTGGAIHAEACTMRIDNSRFDDNQAGYVGGAIYVYGKWDDVYAKPVMDLVVSNSLFTGNLAIIGPGGTMPHPTTGGAVMMEDQTRGRFYNCRFINNSAGQGGALSSYRTTTEIDNCVFRGNTAKSNPAAPRGGDGFGGAIFVLSDDNADDSTERGTKNRPASRLTVTDSLIQGGGGSAVSAEQGGGIFVAGDLHSAFGVDVPKNGSLESNRAVVELKRVLFSDIKTDATGLSTGGAMTADFVTLTLADSIVQNCSSKNNGGGVQVISSSVANITNTTFARNSAGVLGGAFNIFGGQLTMSGCKFVDNRITRGGGSAIMAAAAPADSGRGLPNTDLTGVVQNCVFSAPGTNDEIGVPIYDGNTFLTGPYNRLQYNSNQIFAGDPAPIFIDNVGYLSIDRLNDVSIPRADGTTSVKVGGVNSSLSAAPVTGALLMIPASVLRSGAPDEAMPLASVVGYATSGGAVTLNGAAQSGAHAIVDTTSDGIQTLRVGNSSFATAPPAGAAVNISTRLLAGAGDNSLIAGFIVQGTAPKRVIVRAVGPSLSAVNVQGALQNPTLELFDARGSSIGRNDNWQSSVTGGALGAGQVVDIYASSVPPSHPLEPAIVATLEPNVPYTAVVGSADGGTGVALVEVYDLEGVQAAKLANISTRGFIQTDQNVMIGGFIYSGGVGATNVVIRGIGPSLGAAGVGNALQDPVLELYNANGTNIATNNNWADDAGQGAIRAAGLQPSQSTEAAMLVTGLPHGAYTAILRGSGGNVGTGLLELYVFQ